MISVRTDRVQLDEVAVVRDVIEHPGAVGVIALDPAERILFVRQYRHAVGYELWEPPAGLLDQPGEPPLGAAMRELVEEAGQEAGSWAVLVDAFTSPGMTDEAIRIYLARDLSAVPRPEGAAEERDMPIAWIDINAAVRLVLTGELHNPMAVMGVLAVAAARIDGFAGLRPASARWPAGPGRLA